MPVLFVNAALISPSASLIDAAAKTVTFPSCAKTDGGLRVPNTAMRQTVQRFMWETNLKSAATNGPRRTYDVSTRQSHRTDWLASAPDCPRSPQRTLPAAKLLID